MRLLFSSLIFRLFLFYLTDTEFDKKRTKPLNVLNQEHDVRGFSHNLFVFLQEFSA